MSSADDLAHELRDLLVGVKYNGSWDRRTEKTYFGVHSCWGNTYSVDGAINNAVVQVLDDTHLRCHLFYSGQYKRANYVEPCVHSGDEELSPSGEVIFTLTLRRLQSPLVSWEEYRNQVPVGGMDHDSNLYTVEAVKNTVLFRLFN